MARLRTCAFQSHAGSIEDVNGKGQQWDEDRFQSHAGSIEVWAQMSRMRPITCFNPTLVRLRNPNLFLLSVPVEFQSHAGSIEAEIRIPEIKLCVNVSIPRWFD